MANTNREVWATPNMEVEEEVCHELPVLPLVTAEQLHQLLDH